MQRKQLVKRNGEWVEEYVDCGPAKALPGHGQLTATIARAQLGPGKRKRGTIQTSEARDSERG